ncbi:10523_t:CDS:2 [Rhizophagus irregularis]|nr:10523_t:CDS:2 [Rhizophagus irregularis]
MEAGYAHSKSAMLLCNTWDLVVSEGSGNVLLVIGSWVLMADDLRDTLMRLKILVTQVF